ncbi:MAG: hypothetical protein EAZ24_10710 [Burkholderiales bacterium]|nr:MAG: hypothetical protein EAZ24_10710 [Burkholderiales bacterium]TAG78412.1 MAG: hypothetical protein EAZ21_12795 [Betaproteobacteria bacterium]
MAAPGAHGPNGEHLDGPVQTVSGKALPRIETSTEQFELIATLHADELSILIDRFATNEPVLNARVEVEAGSLKASAKFHADHGDYAVDDPAFLTALASVGEHALVFTVVSGKDSDLLSANLVQSATTFAAGGTHASHDKDHHGHEHGGVLRWGLAALTTALLAWAATRWARRRKRARPLPPATTSRGQS